MVEIVTKRIENTDAPAFHKQLFTGHRGSGKSTILRQIAGRLHETGRFAVYADVESVLDISDVAPSDVLLALARAVFDALDGEGLEPDPALLRDLAAWFDQTMLTSEQRTEREAIIKGEAGAQASFGFLAKVTATVTGQLRAGRIAREEVRRTVAPDLRRFLERLNLVLDDAAVRLERAGRGSLVVLIDGLDKVYFRELDGGRTSHTALFVEGAEQLKSPRCHVVYTAPVSLVFNVNLGLSFDLYDVIPMVKITEADGVHPHAEGRQKLRELIACRVELATIFANEQDVMHLVESSGGAVRDLLRLVRFACDEATERVERTHVEAAVRSLMREFDYLIREADLDELARVSRDRDAPRDQDGRLLFQTLVLQYLNGETWFDLHPAVRATRRVRARIAGIAPGSSNP